MSAEGNRFAFLTVVACRSENVRPGTHAIFGQHSLMHTKLLALPAFLVVLCVPDIAPNPRHRSALDLSPRDAEQTGVAMRAEVVELFLHPDHAEVKAVFDLEHTGSEPETLEVGFPTEARPIERGIDKGLEYARSFYDGGTIYGFSAEVDGVPVKAESKKVDEDDPRKVHRSWVCWPMEFAPGQKRRVSLRYEVETRDAFYLDPTSALEPRELFYVLKTGRGWKDVIGSARIVLRTAPGVDLDMRHIQETSPAPTSKTDGEWEWLFENFEPDEDIRVRYNVHRDAEQAVERLRPQLEKQPDQFLLMFDLAENLAALGQHAEAAPLFGRLADWISGRPGVDRPRSRIPKIVHVRRYYRPVSWLAAVSYQAAGEPELAIEYRDRGLKSLDRRIDDLRRSIKDDRAGADGGAVLAELVAARDQLRAMK